MKSGRFTDSCSVFFDLDNARQSPQKLVKESLRLNFYNRRWDTRVTYRNNNKIYNVGSIITRENV